MIRFIILAMLFLLGILFSNYVMAAPAVCGKPSELAAILNKSKYFEDTVYRAKEGYSISLFSGNPGWVLVLWNDQDACVVAHGERVFVIKSLKT